MPRARKHLSGVIMLRYNVNVERSLRHKVAFQDFRADIGGLYSTRADKSYEANGDHAALHVRSPSSRLLVIVVFCQSILLVVGFLIHYADCCRPLRTVTDLQAI